MFAGTVRRRLPTVLVLDFWDSYTRNVLRLVHQIAAGIDFDGQEEWDCTDWQDRVVVLNVDSLSWCVHPLLLATRVKLIVRCAGILSSTTSSLTSTVSSWDLDLERRIARRTFRGRRG
jgi:hypothetical protein